jgi:hypothetical protein
VDEPPVALPDIPTIFILVDNFIATCNQVQLLYLSIVLSTL